MAASTMLLFQISSSTLVLRRRCILPVSPSRVYVGFKAVRCSFSSSPSSIAEENRSQDARAVSLLEKLRLKHLKHANPNPKSKPKPSKTPSSSKTDEKAQSLSVTSFEEMGLSGELMGVLDEMGIKVPTEVQCLGVPAIMRGESIVLASHTGSGKTLAYMLPLVQLLRRDEAEVGMQTKPKRPRAVILCPTRELSEQVFRVAKSVSHHARFRSTMIGGGSRMRPQEDALNHPIEMVVGTPGRLLEHINQGNMFYGDIKYVVLDEADTMFDRGFGPDLRKFLNPLRNRASKSGDQGFQSVLVTATITKAVQKLLDEEFQGIVHIRTSTLHKKIASAFHDFIKLSGTENKLEALLQVLEPSLAKGNRVMVFCNTLDSSRAVDHFLNENQVSTVNYHGEVPAEQRVENLNKFKSDDSDCPTLVCTDLAARGLDLAVDHVIMFDFPLTPIDYLHRTGRTARMGAKGKVTSLVTKKDTNLASQIEDAIRRNESLEALTTYKEQLEERRKKQIEQKLKENGKIKMKTSSQKTTQTRAGHAMSPKTRSNVVRTAPKMPKINSQKNKQVKVSVASARKKQVSAPKTSASRSVKKVKGKTKVWKTEKAVASRLSVVGFKGKQNS